MNEKNVCILDYGSGNVKSVYNVFKYLGFDADISNEKRVIKNASHIVLPGVGAYGPSMEKIHRKIPFDVLENQVLVSGKPFLGICLGMQVLSDKGTEFGSFDGFGWIGGTVDLLESNALSLPHIGWNEVNKTIDCELLNGVEELSDFYFVHSYVFNVKNQENIAATSYYGSEFTSVVKKENIYGMQFHPEKSQQAGQNLINNFMSIK